jgi:thioredoxin 1
MRNMQRNYPYIIILSLFCLLFVAGCSSGGVAPAQSTSLHELSIELPGTESNTNLIDSQGKLLKKAVISSSDGNISLAIESGTVLLDENKTPLQSIKVTIDQAIPIPPEDAEIIGDIFDIQPQSAVINPSLYTTFSYDPSGIPQGVSENDLWVYHFNGSSWERVNYKNHDMTLNRVTTKISRFGKYSVLVPIKPIAAPAASSQTDLTSITPQQALTNGKPTLAEFGRGTCIPCKQMKPILEDLAEQYRDKMNVPIVSVDDYRDLTSYYKIMAIPTQIVFDSKGKEVFRHIGFWSKEQILSQLVKLGIK